MELVLPLELYSQFIKLIVGRNGEKHNRPTRIRFHGEKAVDMQKHIGDSMLINQIIE